MDAVVNRQLDPERTRFLLYAPKAHPGAFAQLLASADDTASLADAISRISNFAGEDGGAEWQQHAKVVAGADQSTLASILRNLSIDTPTGSPADTLPPLLASKLVSDDVLDDVIKWAHGWVKDSVDALPAGSQATLCALHGVPCGASFVC